MIPIARPDIDLYSTAQRAIVVWNGKEEIIILSTNVASSEPTKVLEILPLPNKPQVFASDFAIFYRLNQLIYERARQLLPEALFFGRKGESVKSDVKILFQKQIGTHSITCVQAYNYPDLLNWIKRYLQSHNLADIQIPKKLPEIIKYYIDSKINYFVFDLIDLNPQEVSITPIAYKFKSNMLYYPLVISRLAEGKTEIQLYTITPGIIDIWDLPLTLQYAYYKTTDDTKIRPICFLLDKTEFQSLFQDKQQRLHINKPYLSVFHFSGDLAALNNDLRVNRLLNYLKY